MSPRVTLLAFGPTDSTRTQVQEPGHLVLSPSPVPPWRCDISRGVPSLLSLVLTARATTVYRGGHGTQGWHPRAPGHGERGHASTKGQPEPTLQPTPCVRHCEGSCHHLGSCGHLWPAVCSEGPERRTDSREGLCKTHALRPAAGPAQAKPPRS